jgi:hypothetical protein
MLKRFLLYGCAGWVAEILFTGSASAALRRDPHARSHTYLWMHPIYGVTALGLEQVARALRRARVPRLLRAMLYVPLIYGAELSTGWLLCRTLGKCPWDYGDARASFRGLVRWDYAPAWYGAALAFEPLAESLGALRSGGLGQAVLRRLRGC